MFVSETTFFACLNMGLEGLKFQFSGLFNTNAQPKHICHSERNVVESKNLGRSPYCFALKPISSLRRRARSFDFGLCPSLRMTSANFAESCI